LLFAPRPMLERGLQFTAPFAKSQTTPDPPLYLMPKLRPREAPDGAGTKAVDLPRDHHA
jgi:hypothetical protein